MAQTQQELIDELSELGSYPKLPATEDAIDDFLAGKKWRRIPKYFYAVGTEIAKIELSLNKEHIKLKKNEIIFCTNGGVTFAYITEIGKKYKSPSDVFFERFG